MGLFKSSKQNGSADRAWYYVMSATIVVLVGLAIAGPETAYGPNGTRYNPFPEISRRLLQGLWITGKVVVLSTFCAILWGIIIGVGRVSRHAVGNVLASMYVEIIRGIPLLVILFMTYYGLNQFLPPHTKLSAFQSAVLGLTVCYGAFIGEAVRAGIQAIPHEELEAASLEGGRWPVLLHVTLPRAVRIILPAVGNECIALLKDSSLISILAISELTRTGQEYATSKFLYFETYAMVALFYLVLTLLLSRAVRLMEKSWD